MHKCHDVCEHLCFASAWRTLDQSQPLLNSSRQSLSLAGVEMVEHAVELGWFSNLPLISSVSTLSKALQIEAHILCLLLEVDVFVVEKDVHHLVIFLHVLLDVPVYL
jgi:hypothetical protein